MAHGDPLTDGGTYRVTYTATLYGKPKVAVVTCRQVLTSYHGGPHPVYVLVGPRGGRLSYHSILSVEAVGA